MRTWARFLKTCDLLESKLASSVTCSARKNVLAGTMHSERGASVSSPFKQSASEHRSPKFAVKLRTTAIRGPHSAATHFSHSFHVDGDKACAFPRAFFLLCGKLPTMGFLLAVPAIGHSQWWFSAFAGGLLPPTRFGALLRPKKSFRPSWTGCKGTVDSDTSVSLHLLQAAPNVRDTLNFPGLHLPPEKKTAYKDRLRNFLDFFGCFDFTNARGFVVPRVDFPWLAVGHIWEGVPA